MFITNTVKFVIILVVVVLRRDAIIMITTDNLRRFIDPPLFHNKLQGGVSAATV